MTKKKEKTETKKENIYEVSENPKTNAVFRALMSGIKSLLSDPVYKDNKELKKMKKIASEVTGGKKAEPETFNFSDDDNTNAFIRAGAKMIRSFSKEETISKSKTIKIIKDVVEIKEE